MRYLSRGDVRSRVGLLAAVAGATALLWSSPASANVSVGSVLSIPGSSTVHDTGVAGSFTVANLNTPPNQADTDTLTSLRLALSCGAGPVGPNPCANADTGVFQGSSPAAGGADTACAGLTFTLSAPDAFGVVSLTPSSTVVLDPPGGAPGSGICRVDFTFDVLKLPTIDVDAAADGIQTHVNLRVEALGAGLTVANNQSVKTTVLDDPDDDDDGVPDTSDACPLVPAATANGCPDVARTVSLSYNERGKFYGGIASSEPACTTRQKVTVKHKLQPGADETIGMDKTNSSGLFRVSDFPTVGFYYAKVKQKTVAGVANCGAARSDTILAG